MPATVEGVLIATKARDAAATISITGDIDSESRDRIKAAIFEAIECGAEHVVLDLAGATIGDATISRIAATCIRTACERQVAIRMVNTTEHIKRLLTMYDQGAILG